MDSKGRQRKAKIKTIDGRQDNGRGAYGGCAGMCIK